MHISNRAVTPLFGICVKHRLTNSKIRTGSEVDLPFSFEHSRPIKKMPGGGYTAPFEPQEQDVVSTKLRSWNLGHPGNLIYAELLVDYALKLPLPSDPNYSAILSETTKELVEDITMERGGRFLKIAEGENHPDDCVVMDFKACHHKVLHGLKNKQRVILTKGVPPKPVKKMEPPKKNEPFKAAPRRPKPKDPEAVVRTTKRVRKQRKFDDEGEEEGPKKRRRKRVKVYEATQREDGTINPYALELISFVCNNRSQPMLEKPGAQYSTPEEEPHHERQIRLQVSIFSRNVSTTIEKNIC